MTTRDRIALPDDDAIDVIIAVILWTLGGAWMVAMMTVMMVVALVVPPDRTEGLSRLYCRGQVALTLSRWRAVVDPAVDPTATYVFTQNHINLLDHVTMYPSTPHFKQGIELEAHFRIPFYGWFMKQRGTIGVRRGEPGAFEALVQAARAEVAHGHSLLVFPEGTRTQTGRVGKLRTGTFRLARELGLPVVPVVVTGMYEVLRKGNPLIHPFRTVTVHVLAPIPTKDLTDDALQELASEVEQRMAALVDSYWQSRGLLPEQDGTQG